jgi:hypothetical protein
MTSLRPFLPRRFLSLEIITLQMQSPKFHFIVKMPINRPQEISDQLQAEARTAIGKTNDRMLVPLYGMWLSTALRPVRMSKFYRHLLRQCINNPTSSCCVARPSTFIRDLRDAQSHPANDGRWSIIHDFISKKLPRHQFGRTQKKLESVWNLA